MEDLKLLEKLYHPKAHILIQLISLLYEIEGCSCGGSLHIVSDDFNLSNSDMDFCKKFAIENNAIEKEIVIAICDILKSMTYEQRSIYVNDFSFIYDNSLELDEIICLLHSKDDFINVLCKNIDIEYALNVVKYDMLSESQMNNECDKDLLNIMN